MKTLKELEKEKLSVENTKVRNLLQSYNRTDISEETKKAILKSVKDCKKAIGNLPDLVRQEIAKHANNLYEGLRDALADPKYRSLYYGDFEDFIEQTASLEETITGYARISNEAYNMDLQRAILYFGLTREELQMLFEKGVCDITRDIFIKYINKRYKTKIPTLVELQEMELKEKGYDIVERTEINYQKKKMKLHNGEYMVGEYPQYYEYELDTYYKELIKESKSIMQRTMKK